MHIGLRMIVDAEVICDQCDASGPSFGTEDDATEADSIEKAVAHWNTRVPNPKEPTL